MRWLDLEAPAHLRQDDDSATTAGTGTATAIEIGGTEADVAAMIEAIE
jgi:hypothetical protein